MKKINKAAACALMAASFAVAGHSFAADDKMMKQEPMAMEKMDMSHETAFSSEAFSRAQADGKPFLVAFHKKGCPICASQKKALNEIYAKPEYKDLRVLVVNYDTDTANLKKFNVGMQGTLILYKGNDEVSRTSNLVEASDIEKQVNG